MAPAPAGRQWISVPCRAPLARGGYVFSRAGFSPGGRARDAAVCSAWLQDEGKDVLQVPLCVMEDHAAAAATWPPQTLVDRLIPDFLWISVEHTAQLSLDGLERNKMRVVPGLTSKAMSVASGYAPRAIVTPIVGAVYRKLGGD